MFVETGNMTWIAGEAGVWCYWFYLTRTDYQSSAINMFVGFLSQHLFFVKLLYNEECTAI